MDRLTDDLLVHILSHLTLKEAARTCVLARRWTCLWRFGALVLDSESLVTAKGDVIEPEKFESLLNTLLQVHDDRCIERIAISFEGGMLQQRHCERMSHSVAIWMYAAAQHDGYGFQMFSRLKSLRLVDVEVEDEAVHHLLASARALEELRVRFSRATKNLRVVDPPSLRVLEISGCYSVESVEVSATKLVSLTYGGGKNSLLLRKAPNLCELSISGEFAASFVLEPKQDYSWRYSKQLVELVLDLKKSASPTPIVVNTPNLPLFASLKRLKVTASSASGHSLRLFTLLVEASPQLVELSLEMRYSYLEDDDRWNIAFPSVCSCVKKFDHKSLKVIEMSGFVGSQDEAELLIELCRNAPLIERVVIHTKSDHYGVFGQRFLWEDTAARTQAQSKKRANYA